ncbi:hypothetical protein [Rhizobium sp. Root1220]|uniref:hypothetical protein n=1 Tax=Rhizobium sp. Root1220 TaxID=1736432 RepID=UPI000B0BCFAC|nr:hypothetical protein [Rhizobium sp. Root1220]
MIPASELRNIIAAMNFIERHEIVEAGYDMPDGSWQHFQENPAERFLKCNDECREAIMRVIEAHTTRAE